MRLILAGAAAFLAIFALRATAQPDAKYGGAYPQAAVFAGGCFWCVESDFEKLDGVGDVVSGYTGGDLENPTYRNHDGHVEAARIPYDPDIVSYRQLVDYFFRHVDPLDAGGQFCDRGHSYTTAIFYADDSQRADAEAAKAEAERVLGEPVVTPILPLKQFWDAEDYHQDYYKKNPVRYKIYRTGCRRDARVKQVWGK
ncbi:MAG: peptide-methionine (S)-S-oxide reductase MsrA [Hyphococcus sp.]